jgi:hypothetical protein
MEKSFLDSGGDPFEHAAMRARREGTGSGSKRVQLALTVRQNVQQL